jgi:hypothetical protein
MVETFELVRFSRAVKENVGDPTMKVTVEELLIAFGLRNVRTGDDNSNGETGRMKVLAEQF